MRFAAALVTEDIVRVIKEAGIFDETKYLSKVEQLSLNIRYVKEGEIKERFLSLEHAVI